MWNDQVAMRVGVEAKRGNPKSIWVTWGRGGRGHFVNVEKRITVKLIKVKTGS